MPRIYYGDREQAEADAERYDEFYDYSQLRSGVQAEGQSAGDSDELFSVLYNGVWPVEGDDIERVQIT